MNVRTLCFSASLLISLAAPSYAQTEDQSASEPARPKEQPSNRMFGVIPNYATVEHPTEIDPIGAGLKFKMASLNTFDPYVYPFVGFQA
ncbi:MAG TPA: hypothetical protein VNZ26_02830, partial [Vicinamibacterales bacterium]|nr:hypothetical protein [Vicinamibacterales bacterium]